MNAPHQNSEARARRPSDLGPSTTLDARAGFPDLAPGPDPALALHDLVGNRLLDASLSGFATGDGFEGALAAEMAASASGLQGIDPMSSNRAMARLMRHAESLDTRSAYEDIERSSGTAMPEGLRNRMERAFERDFSGVRLHTDAAAGRAAQALNAHAFALGADVFFGTGAFAPGTERGDRLLAHELTHVAQHQDGRLPSRGDDSVSSPSDPHEREAYANEVQIARSLAQVDAELAEEARGGPTPSGPAQAEEEASTPSTALLQWLLGDRASEVPGPIAKRLAQVLGGRQPDLVDPSAQALEALSALAEALGSHDFLPPELQSQLSPEQTLEAPVGSPEDAARTAQTAALLDRVLGLLGLPSGAVVVEMREDLGHAGLMQHGQVLLDPAAFDPTTAEGRALLAHEVVHVAQDRLQVDPTLDQPGELAEAEAHIASHQFAQGQGMLSPVMGIPQGHVAADDGAANLQAALAQYSAATQGRAGNLPQVQPTSASPSETAEEDSDTKLSRYEDGVDGIADLIEDLSAFDDLCDAYDDYTGSERTQRANSAMARIRSSEPYSQLKRMWQGAKEGGAVEAEMKAVFNNEFDDRGFYESTEQAFDHVERCAKAEARPEAEAQEARSELNNSEAPTNEQAQGEGEGGGEAGSANGGLNTGAASEGGGDFASMEVGQTVPLISEFEALKGVTDQNLADIVVERNHQIGIGNDFSGNAPEYGRGGQILETFIDSFAGDFAKGFTDGFIDAAILDTLGGVADKGLTLATRGAVRTPMIGPMIQLIQSNPFSPDFYKGLGDTASKGGKSLSSSWDNMMKIGDGATFTDNLGIFCAALADLFSGLSDILGMVQQIVGCLSALCYIAGGICIIFGIALLWLAGVGAPFVTAGGWLVRAGGLLARVNSALGLVVLVLSGLAAVFRVAAAFMVPAEMYATQLGGVAEAGSAFGEKAGNKVGDMAGSRVSEAVQNGVSPDTQRTPDGEEGDGPARAQEDAAAVRDDVDAANRDLQDQTTRAAENIDGQRVEDGPPREGEGPARDADGPPRDADTSGPAARTRLRRLASAVVRPITNLCASVRDMGRLFTNPDQSAREGLAPYLRGREQVAEAQRRVDELERTIGDTPETDAATIRDLGRQLSSAHRDLTRAQDALRVQTVIEDGLANSRVNDPDADARAAHSRNNDSEEGVQRLRDDLTAKQSELESAQGRREQLGDDLTRVQSELEAARQAADVERQARDELNAQQEHIQGHDDASRARQQADNLTRQQTGLNDDAGSLRQQANNAERAQGLRQEAEGHQSRAEESSRAADQSVQAIQGRWGDKRVRVTIDGEPTQRRVISTDANGITVTDGRNGRRHVPWSDVNNQTMQGMGHEAQQRRQSADEATALADTRNREADGLDPDRSDPSSLRDEADAKERQANDMTGQIEAANGRSTYDSPLSREEHQAQADKARERLGRAEGAEGRLRALQDQLRTIQEDRNTTSEQVEALRTQISELQTQVSDADSMRQQTDHVERGTSGNATGGTGSAYKDMFEKDFFNLVTKVTFTRDLFNRLTPEGAPGPETFGGAAEAGVDNILNPATADEIQRLGRQQALVETLLTMTPPAEMEAMFEHRDAARQAYAEYTAAHEEAARCHAASEVVGAMAADTDEMARSGEVIVQGAQDNQRGVQEGQATEDRRAAHLGNANTNTPEQDAGFAAMVGELIIKLASNSDAMEGDASAGGADGDAMADAQGQADTASTEETEASRGYSDEQRALLDQALAGGQQEEQAAQANIASLQQKHGEELTIRDAIITQKVGALTRREEAKARVVEESTAFTSDYAELSSWAQEYAARRATIENPSGS